MTQTQVVREGASSSPALVKREPGWQAFAVLRTLYVVAPLLFGIDKFFNLMTHWPDYLAPLVTQVIPVTPQQFMYAVGVIEIVAAACVLFFPRIGSALVVLWLAGIIVDLLVLGDFYDVALRDFGLLVAALVLFRLSLVYAPRVVAKRA
jgi:hypothetical protein